MFFKRNRSYEPGRISVTNPDVQSKIRFHGLTEDDLGVIKAWQDACRGALDRMVDSFYKHVMANPEPTKILNQHTTIERQRPMLSRYILTMFEGQIDDQYIEYRYKVGQVHDRIALDSHWFTAMYEVIRQSLFEAVEKAGATTADLRKFQNALNRLLQVDMAFVMMSQADTYKDKIEVLTGEVEARLNEAQAFLDEEARVLAKVSARDLTLRMEGEFKGHYKEIQTMLNQTIDNLYDSICQIALGAEQVSAASGEISSSSQSLAQSASEQAATLEEMSANFQEIVSMSNRNADNARVAFEMTDSAFQSSERGGKSMSELSDAMTKIKNSSDATARIVKTIEEIAFQTNLLALNAAVEAARAGDAGKGFAVVAEEVRNLAMRSAEAAKNTAQMIDESVNNTQAGVRLNEEVLENLTEIRVQVQKVSQMMNDISADSNSQHRTVENISNSIEQINHATQSVAASSEEAASASEELAGQSQEMLSLINSYHLGDQQHGNTFRSRNVAKPANLSSFSKAPAKKTSPKPRNLNGSSNGNSASKGNFGGGGNLIPFDDFDDSSLNSF